MKQIGEMTISYKSIKNGIYYYDLMVQIEGQTRHIVLPRFHPLVGWIELFGLPPQNEWVVLTDVAAFSKTAELVIDDVVYEESCTYTHDIVNKTHTIETTRSGNSIMEEAVCVESYKDAPTSIRNTMKFISDSGEYICEMEKSLVTLDELTYTERMYVADIIESHGRTEHIWKKTFKAGGLPPKIYYTFFPQISGVDITNIAGSVIEVGYMKGDDDVDAVHGDWYKRFQFGNQVLHTNESGYTSRTIETENGPQKIKDTYCKKLYR